MEIYIEFEVFFVNHDQSFLNAPHIHTWQFTPPGVSPPSHLAIPEPVNAAFLFALQKYLAGVH